MCGSFAEYQIVSVLSAEPPVFSKGWKISWRHIIIITIIIMVMIICVKQRVSQVIQKDLWQNQVFKKGNRFLSSKSPFMHTAPEVS